MTAGFDRTGPDDWSAPPSVRPRHSAGPADPDPASPDPDPDPDPAYPDPAYLDPGYSAPVSGYPAPVSGYSATVSGYSATVSGVEAGWEAGRPGPLPPRMEPPTAAHPVYPPPPYPPPLAYPPPSAGTPLGGGVATGGVPTFGGGGPGGAPLPVGAYPPAAPSTVPVPVPVQAVAVAPDPYAGQPAYPVPVQRSPGQSQAPVTGIPAPQGFPGYGLPTVVGPAAPRRGRWQAIVMVMLLVAVLGQGVFLVVLQRQVSAADRHITQLRSDAAKNQAGLNTRVKALEQQAAQSLDSAAVAEAVLPSVFRVDAGNFSGTAFALGKSAPSGGGTDLLTNFHVVSSVYNKGGRDATLTHDNQRFAVKITKVDQTNDLALLHSNQNFTRLAVNSGTIESGTPIVVIGAPLGLSQSVTTGVVSAVRNDFPGEAGKTFIQFSAPINPGNSGGPVVNAQKQVVGIASAKANDAEGIGLAIPIGVGCTFTASC